MRTVWNTVPNVLTAMLAAEVGSPSATYLPERGFEANGVNTAGGGRGSPDAGSKSTTAIRRQAGPSRNRSLESPEMISFFLSLPAALPPMLFWSWETAASWTRRSTSATMSGMAAPPPEQSSRRDPGAGARDEQDGHGSRHALGCQASHQPASDAPSIRTGLCPTTIASITGPQSSAQRHQVSMPALAAVTTPRRPPGARAGSLRQVSSNRRRRDEQNVPSARQTKASCHQRLLGATASARAIMAPARPTPSHRMVTVARQTTPSRVRQPWKLERVIAPTVGTLSGHIIATTNQQPACDPGQAPGVDHLACAVAATWPRSAQRDPRRRRTPQDDPGGRGPYRRRQTSGQRSRLQHAHAVCA